MPATRYHGYHSSISRARLFTSFIASFFFKVQRVQHVFLLYDAVSHVAHAAQLGVNVPHVGSDGSWRCLCHSPNKTSRITPVAGMYPGLCRCKGGDSHHRFWKHTPTSCPSPDTYTHARALDLVRERHCAWKETSVPFVESHFQKSLSPFLGRYRRYDFNMRQAMILCKITEKKICTVDLHQA